MCTYVFTHTHTPLPVYTLDYLMTDVSTGKKWNQAGLSYSKIHKVGEELTSEAKWKNASPKLSNKDKYLIYTLKSKLMQNKSGETKYQNFRFK